MKDSFSRLHPLTNLLFFIAATGFSMFLMHPVCLVISLACALCYALFLGGKQTALFALRFLLPVALVMVLVNPLVSHRGATVLGYLPWGNPFTLESVLYGCASAALVCAIRLPISVWFSMAFFCASGTSQVMLPRSVSRSSFTNMSCGEKTIFSFASSRKNSGREDPSVSSRSISVAMDGEA